MNEFDNLFEELQRKIEKYSLNTPPQSSVGELPTSIKVLQINPNNLMEFIDESIPLDYLLIDEKTFYLCDITALDKSHYRSLMFQIDGFSFKSKETTSQIMKRYFKNNVPYKTIQHLGKTVGITQRCPYILGEIQFAPDKGTSKNNANWIGLHNVLNLDFKQPYSQLGIVNHHSLCLSNSFKQVSDIIKKAEKLYHAQQRFSDEWKQLFIQKLPRDHPQNIVSRMYNENISKEKLPSPLSWHTRLVYSLSHDLLTDVLKEGDPYREDILKTFSEIEDNLK